MKHDQFRFFGLFSALARVVGDPSLTDIAFDVMDIVHIALREDRGSNGVPDGAFTDRYRYLSDSDGVPSWMPTKKRGAR